MLKKKMMMLKKKMMMLKKKMMMIKKKMIVRDLTIEDMEGIEVKDKSRFDVLVATAERAKHILGEHEAAQIQEINTTTYPKKKRERAADMEAESSSAAAARAKRKKSNATSKKKNVIGNGPQPPPPLPINFKNVIEQFGGGKETLVIQKGLFVTDLSKNHNRLSIPISRTRDDFLTEEEKSHLRSHGKNNRKNHIDVDIIEPSLRKDKVKVSRWDMSKKKGKASSCYVINGNWKDIAVKNELRVGMVVQVWSFRIEGKLWFALVKLPQIPPA